MSSDEYYLKPIREVKAIILKKTNATSMRTMIQTNNRYLKQCNNANRTYNRYLKQCNNANRTYNRYLEQCNNITYEKYTLRN